MARVIAVAPDLLLASKVEAMLSAAGHDVALTPRLAGTSMAGAEAIVADLDAESPEDLVATGLPVVGYYSHVEAETKRAADAAGVEIVVPRSRMARELPDLVERLLS